MTKRAWVRGALTLALIGGLAAALITSPVVAFEKGDKKKVRRIATKKATKVFNNLIGPATATFLEASDILAVSQEDSDGEITTPTTQINTLSITAPAAGFLLISGQAELDSDGAASDLVCLRPRVDGTNVLTGTGTSDGSGPDGEAACFEYDTDVDQPVDAATVSYTVLQAVAAGPHTVTQDVIFADEPFDWFSGTLTALFVPSGSTTTAPRGTTPSRNG